MCLQTDLRKAYLSLIGTAAIVPHRFTRLLRKVSVMNVVREFRNWRRYRNTVNELSRLSTRELNDLGITRSDIPYVARKSL